MDKDNILKMVNIRKLEWLNCYQIDFKTKSITRNKKLHVITMKVPTHKEDITIINDS